MDFTIEMAIVDFIPVLLFGVAAVILQRDLYNKMSKGAFALFAAGTIDVFAAGLLKALWKLLFAANVCDFSPLNNMFFPVQAIGFLLAGAGIVALLSHKQTEKTAMLAVAPTVFSGTIIFVTFMVGGVLCMNAGLAYIAKKMKKYLAVVLFIVAFICSLAMGYLSSRDFALASMNWIAEAVNVIGQGCFLGAALILRRSGLKDSMLEKKA